MHQRPPRNFPTWPLLRSLGSTKMHYRLLSGLFLNVIYPFPRCLGGRRSSSSSSLVLFHLYLMSHGFILQSFRGVLVDPDAFCQLNFHWKRKREKGERGSS